MTDERRKQIEVAYDSWIKSHKNETKIKIFVAGAEWVDSTLDVEIENCQARIEKLRKALAGCIDAIEIIQGEHPEGSELWKKISEALEDDK